MTNTNIETQKKESGGYKYGSVNNQAEVAEGNNNSNFKESDLYYYKEEKLTKREKRIKSVKFAVPIIISILLIGGLTWALFRNFGTLYPGPDVQRIPPNGQKASHPATSTTSSTNDNNTNTTNKP